MVPSTLKEEILREIHEGVISGHLGEQKMMHQLTERFYWPGMSEDVRNWCQTSASCATKKSPSPKACAPLQTIKAGHPMQIIAVDIKGPFPELGWKSLCIGGWRIFYTMDGSLRHS